ncbi:MAG TPA: Arc family DNA-binding protein [Longimicrobiaceae bacterium]|jgi:plasmid stability protein|nr:Arc family DNA-binding protein [Longimicrobiaceae bacterium]
MATLTIKGFPDDLYDQLRQRAAENRRSLNSEAIVCLENAVRERRRDAWSLLARADALRNSVSAPPLTDEMIEFAKNEGRP